MVAALGGVVGCGAGSTLSPTPASAPEVDPRGVPSCSDGMPPVREFYEENEIVDGVVPEARYYRDLVAQRAENMPALRECYQRGLERDPRLEGAFQLRWFVGPDGGVERIELASRPTLRDCGVVTCVMRQAVTWRFIARDETQRYELRIRFENPYDDDTRLPGE